MEQKNLQIALAIICTLFLSINLVSAWEPIVQPIPNQEIKLGQIFQYQVIASDEDNDTLTYVMDPYNIGLGMQIDQSGFMSWDPKANNANLSTYPVSVYVEDVNNSIPASFNMTVLPEDTTTNSAPIIQSIPDQTTTLGENFTYQTQASDPDNDSLLYTINRVCSTSEMNELGCPDLGMGITQSGLIFWNPQNEKYAPVNFTVNVSVSDRINPPASTLMFLAVHNPAPIVGDIPDQTVMAGQLLTFNINATNFPLWEILYYTLDADSFNKGMSINNGTFTWQPTNSIMPGIYPVNVSITDFANPAIQKQFNINVIAGNNSNQTNNSAPVVQQIEDMQIMPGDNLTIQINATDADNDTLTYSLNSDESGMQINQTGFLQWNTTNMTQNGTHLINIGVSDNVNMPVMVSFKVQVGNHTDDNQTDNQTDINQTLAIKILNNLSENSMIECDQSIAAQIDGNPNTITANAYMLNESGQVVAQKMMDYDNATKAWNALFTKLELVKEGNYSILINASDRFNHTSSETMNVKLPQLICVAMTPNVCNIDPLVGGNCSFTFYTRSRGANAIQFSLEDMNGWTPQYLMARITSANTSASVGNVNTTSPVFNGQNLTLMKELYGSSSFILSLVIPANVTGVVAIGGGYYINPVIVNVSVLENQTNNTAPIIQPISNMQIMPGDNLTVQVNATDTENNTLAYSMEANESGMSINNQSGLFMWNTTNTTSIGNYTINIEVSDGNLTSNTTFMITVGNESSQSNQTNNETLVFLPVENQTVMQGDNLSVQLNATLNETNTTANETIIYSFGSQSNQTGMELNSTSGLFTWQTTNNTAVGNYTVIILANDVFHPIANVTLMISVLNNTNQSNQTNNSAPVWSVIQNQSVVMGEIFGINLSAYTTDAENDTLLYTVGNFPQGLVIASQTGELTWNTTFNNATVGNYTIDVLVKDDFHDSFTASTFNLEVLNQTNQMNTTGV
jgi:hypothetical protein